MKSHKLIYFLTLTLVLAGTVTYSQTNKFELSGYISGCKTGKIALREILVNQNINKSQNEISIHQGKFLFKGEILDPTEVIFIINDTLSTNPFFLESGKHKTSLNIDSLLTPVILQGSKTNNEFLGPYSNKMEPYRLKIENWYNDNAILENSFNNQIPLYLKDSMGNALKDITRQRDSTLLKYIQSNPTSPVAVWNLYYRVYVQGYQPIYDDAYSFLGKESTTSHNGIMLRKLLDAGRRTRVGVKFPKVTVIDSLKSPITVFTKGRAKYTLIDFWFSGCIQCIRQFEELKNTYTGYTSKGFSILGISIDKKEDETEWKNAIMRYELPWLQYWDIAGKEASRLSIQTYPSNFLLDIEGNIIAKDLEPYELETFLKERLQLL